MLKRERGRNRRKKREGVKGKRRIRRRKNIFFIIMMKEGSVRGDGGKEREKKWAEGGERKF